MGKIVTKNQPCLDQVSCGSSDGRQIYEDGSSHCFACNKTFRAGVEEMSVPSFKKKDTEFQPVLTVEEIKAYQSRGFAERKISKVVAEFFDVKVSYDENGQIEAHYYPYVDNGNTSYKVRKLPKIFSSVGKFKGLFGMDKFNSGGKKLIITEGELDAMSIAQASQTKYGKIYPVVSMGAASNTKQLLENREWIRSFNEVILCFDKDKAGEEATEIAIKIVGIDKVKIAKLPHKDPSEVLVKEDGEALLRCIWDATNYTPAGIIGKEDLWKALEEYNQKEAVPYAPCLEGVNSKLKGHRTGEITLFISGTGSGKSSMLREDILHILGTTDSKVGIVSLEEAPAETARKLSGMIINRNPAEEEIPLEDLKVGFDAVFGNDKVVLLDHQGSIKDGSIVEQLEYMCLMGCKYIYVDHITILVSEGSDGLSGNEAVDKVMNDLLRLVKSHDVWIGLVSHLRKAPTGGKSFEEGKLPSIDDIRGSGSIKQISFDIIAFARDLTAENEETRNQIQMVILKSRYTGLTGPVPGCYYKQETGRLHALSFIPKNEFSNL